MFIFIVEVAVVCINIQGVFVVVIVVVIEVEGILRMGIFGSIVGYEDVVWQGIVGSQIENFNVIEGIILIVEVLFIC